jgi:hypothetical protein
VTRFLESEENVNRRGIKPGTNPDGFSAAYQPSPGECTPPGILVTYQIVSQSSWAGQSAHVDVGADMNYHHPKNTSCPLPPQITPTEPNGYWDSPQSSPGDWTFQLAAVATCRSGCKDKVLSTYYFEFDEKTRKITKRDPTYVKHFQKGMRAWWEGDNTVAKYYDGPVPF